jgi:hypothetical protein
MGIKQCSHFRNNTTNAYVYLTEYSTADRNIYDVNVRRLNYIQVLLKNFIRTIKQNERGTIFTT